MWHDKLNKKHDGTYQIVDEVIKLENGVWEGYLKHDNIIKDTLFINTEKKLAGENVDTYYITKDDKNTWKFSIRVLHKQEILYVSYETKGDTVEAEDINKLQNYKANTSYVDSEVKNLDDKITTIKEGVNIVKDDLDKSNKQVNELSESIIDIEKITKQLEENKAGRDEITLLEKNKLDVSVFDEEKLIVDSKIGDLNKLETIARDNLVNAINEVNSKEISTSKPTPRLVGEVKTFSLEAGNAYVDISFTDPDDVYSNDNILYSEWQKTIIVRKEGSYSSNIDDGVIVLSNSIRNQYRTKPFRDNCLINDKTYYYTAFTVSTSEGVSKGKKQKATPEYSWIYGFEVDETNLNPETAVKYIGDNTEFIPAKVVDGKVNYGNWEKFIKDISYRVVVKNGVEQYKVQYDDPTKKLDGSPAIITGEDGDLFTKFILIWRKYTKTAKGYKIELSNKPFTGAKSLVSELENGYNQFSNPIMILLQDLYLLIFKDRNSRTALGRGYVGNTDDFTSTGGTNGKGYIFGETTGKIQMCFLGIEDFWGNLFQWVDGLVSDSSYNILTGTKSFNDSGSGYIKFTTGITEVLSGYARKVQGGDCGYILADKDGSSSTGYCDSGRLNSGLVARFGGHRSDDGYAGAFRVRLANSASTSHSDIGSRLCFKNTEGVYVGNYLGFVDGTKLRSISGKIPTGDKKIGTFRTYAQNNN